MVNEAEDPEMSDHDFDRGAMKPARYISDSATGTAAVPPNSVGPTHDHLIPRLNGAPAGLGDRQTFTGVDADT